jgi:hypothetical protein
MRIALVLLNGAELNGETTFAIGLNKGLLNLNIKSDLIALNGRGKSKKYDYVFYGIKYFSYKNIAFLNEYDIIFFISGKFKSDYSEFDFSVLNKPKILAYHNCSSFKTYNLEYLNNNLKPDLIISSDLSICDFFGKKTFYLEIPFDTNRKKASHTIKNRLIVPTRFTFAKNIDYVCNSLNKIDKKVDFYGNKDFYYHTIKKEFESNKNFILNPVFTTEEERISVFTNALIGFDGSDFKTFKEKIQSVQLECFHHEVIPSMKGKWENSFFKKGVNFIPIEDFDMIYKAIEDRNFAESIIENNKKLLLEYSCDKIAKKFLNILSENGFKN